VKIGWVTVSIIYLTSFRLGKGKRSPKGERRVEGAKFWPLENRRRHARETEVLVKKK